MKVNYNNAETKLRKSEKNIETISLPPPYSLTHPRLAYANP